MLNWILFCVVVVFWGCSFIAIRFSLEAIPPFAAAGLRVSIATIFLAFLAVIQNIPFAGSKRVLGKLTYLGLINFAIPWGCLFWGEQFVPPAVASILNSTMPFFVFLFSWVLLPAERPTFWKLLGVGLGFVGILFVFVPTTQHFSVDRFGFYGMISITIMSISYALGAVLMKSLHQPIDIRWNISLQGISAALALFSLSFFVENRDWMFSLWTKPKASVSIFYLAVCSTAIAWIIFFRLIRVWNPLRASAITYVVPFVAVLADWLYFKKIPSTEQMIGAFLIISAVVLINLARRTPISSLPASNKIPTIVTTVQTGEWGRG